MTFGKKMKKFEKDIHWDIFEDYLRKGPLAKKPQGGKVSKYREWLKYIYDHLGIEPFNAKRNELPPGNTHAALYVKLKDILEQKYQYKLRCGAISALRTYLKFKEKR